MLDAGHGGENFGAIGSNGTKESVIALQVTKKVRRNLENEGFKVVLTRSNDENVSLAARSNFVAVCKADMLVSIHLNGFFRKNVNGIETLYLKQKCFCKKQFLHCNNFNERKRRLLEKIIEDNCDINAHNSKQLAGNVHDQIITSLRKQKYTVIDRGLKPRTCRILLRANIPSTLIEIGFITNNEEESRLRTDVYQNIIARSISKGIKQTLKNKKVKCLS